MYCTRTRIKSVVLSCKQTYVLQSSTLLRQLMLLFILLLLVEKDGVVDAFTLSALSQQHKTTTLTYNIFNKVVKPRLTLSTLYMSQQKQPDSFTTTTSTTTTNVEEETADSLTEAVINAGLKDTVELEAQDESLNTTQPVIPSLPRKYKTFMWKYNPNKNNLLAKAAEAIADTAEAVVEATETAVSSVVEVTEAAVSSVVGNSNENDKQINSKQDNVDDSKDSEMTFAINYRVHGPIEGPPVLLIHGFGANVNHFRYNIPVLAQAGYCVYAIDLLGFGASDKPDLCYTMDVFGQLVSDFIIAQQEERKKSSNINIKWFVAGNSIGGLCALDVATRIPHLMRGVILLNCSGGLSGFRYKDVNLCFRPLLWFIQNVMLGPLWGPRFFKNFKTRSNVESVLKQVYRKHDNVNQELLDILLTPSEDEGAQQVFLRVMAGPPGPTPRELLSKIDVDKCPLLVLWGADDPWTPVTGPTHGGLQYHKYIKQCNNERIDSSDKVDNNGNYTLEVLPGGGHCIHDEFPDVVNEKMITWMNNVQQSN